jgi:mRNA interferase MazF
MVVRQFDVFLINLDPAVGHEIKKSRPCVIISPDEMNDHLASIIIAPLTSKSHNYPTRVAIKFQRKNGWIVLDQIRTADKMRLIRRLGHIDASIVRAIKSVLKEMLVD